MSFMAHTLTFEPLPFDPRLSIPRTALGLRPAASASVYRRRRIAVTLALVLFGAVVWTAVSVLFGLGERAAAGPESPSGPVAPIVHIVAPGDTLWSITASLDVDGDIREMVDALVAANGGSGLQVGQRIEVPG